MIKLSIFGNKICLIENQKTNSNTRFKKFNIILYLGGSGDFKILKNLAEAIDVFLMRKREKDTLIKIIVGPLLKNSDNLKSIAKKK